MRSFLSEQFIFKVGAKLQAAFTAATTNIITSAAHGLTNGDSLLLTTVTTLPAGLSLATKYYVIDKTTDTFKLSATPSGTEVDITDTGTGTHTFTLQGKNIMVQDWRHVQLNCFTANSASFTIKVQASDQEDVNFSAAASSTNRWAYIQLKDLLAAATTDGSTGIAPVGTDFAKNYEVNVNGKIWLTANFAAAGAGWSAGNINLIVCGYND